MDDRPLITRGWNEVSDGQDDRPGHPISPGRSATVLKPMKTSARLALRS